MSIEGLRQKLVRRLEEADRGDRGWFVITRIHVGLSWLKGIADYLYRRGGSGAITLTDQDYAQLARIIETDSVDPGVQLRRHHLLVMDKPLQLLRRLSPPNWATIVLSERGLKLAQSEDPAEVLEESLADMRFAVEPWAPPHRVVQYEDFDVPVYATTKRVLEECGGYFNRDEFDLFVSRVRRPRESIWAIKAIREYRTFSVEDQRSLHREVRSRIPSNKTYQNWRDIGLHTFSLFSLGTSMVRQGDVLLLTEGWSARQGEDPMEDGSFELRLPEPPEAQELLTPPAAPASNDGSDAESFVAKVLRAHGWTVAFYTSRRGYGFDLWAYREERAMVVEVKSSIGALQAVTMTQTEYQAAQKYGDSYVLALVENMGSEAPVLWFIQNPLANVQSEMRRSAVYTISRAQWTRAVRENM